jgi:hypothetical protein
MTRSPELMQYSCPLSMNKGQEASQFAPLTNSQCVIKLDPFQFNYYEQSRIEIHSPNGEYLESIGYDIQQQTQEEQTTQLQEQIVLLQSLCEKITQEVVLTAQAIAGLGDLLFRVRGIIEKQSR